MPSLGKKYTCYSCHTKFYDLGKPVPNCPKCGADQRDAEEAPVTTSSRSRRVVEVPIEDDFESDEAEITPAAGDDAVEDEEFVADPADSEADDDDDEEEY
jgi:hypothetical protein